MQSLQPYVADCYLKLPVKGSLVGKAYYPNSVIAVAVGAACRNPEGAVASSAEQNFWREQWANDKNMRAIYV